MKIGKINSLYLIGSLRNEAIPEVSESLRTLGLDVFDDWYAAGPEADDYWKKYEVNRGRSYKEALLGHAARHVFEFDKYHLDRCDAALLVLPAGKSGHLELGYVAGALKPAFILLDGQDSRTNLKSFVGWEWLAGVYEGEGSIGFNNTKTKNNLQIQLTSTDEDVIDRLIQRSGDRGKKQGPYQDKGLNFKKPPKFIKPKFRWAVYKKADILYILKGILPHLCARRKEQIFYHLNYLGWVDDLDAEIGPFEDRWDVMYQFATEVFHSKEEMIGYFKSTV